MKLPDRKVLAIGAVILVAVAAAGGGIAWKAQTPETIGEVRAACKDASGPVKTTGRVKQVLEVPFLDVSAYRLVDDRDSLWVVSFHPAPEENRTLIVKGRARPAAQIERECQEGRDLGDLCKVVGMGVRLFAGSCVMIEDFRK